MKKLVSLMLVLFLFVFSTFTVLAHPGRTDSKGGHYDKSTGEYHYHHGYSAHQHPNGECPYDFKDKTNSSSTSNKSNDYYNYFSTTVQPTQKTKNENSRETMNYLLIFTIIVILSLIFYIFSLKGKLKTTGTLLSEEREKLHKATIELRALKNNQSAYEDELNYHLLLKEALENTKKPKYMLCGTPFLRKQQEHEARYNNELQINKKLKYHIHPYYIETNKIITEILGTEITYTYDYLIERCFKHIYSYKFGFLPKKDIIQELQAFLRCWLRFYPQLIIDIDEDSLALYILIAITKQMLLKGTTEADIFGLYKYRNDNYLTSEGHALKLFMDYCYTELYNLDKITERTMNRCRWKVKNSFPDTFN